MITSTIASIVVGSGIGIVSAINNIPWWIWVPVSFVAGAGIGLVCQAAGYP